MNKALEIVIDKVKALPDNREREVADILDRIISPDDAIYTLTEEEDRLVQEALNELDHGLIASEDDARAVVDKYRK